MSNLPSHSLAFQSTLLQEERQQIRQTASDGKNFNPRSYKRSDSIGFFFVANDLIFQSTLLQEERQDLIFRSAVEFLFQSTLLQEERRGIFTQKTDRNLISIHAPTRGATLMNFLTDVLYEFQSTLLQEERHVGNGYMYWIYKISIHAPTRGATHKGGSGYCIRLFQSTLLQEERRNLELLKQIRLDDFNPRSYKRSDNCNTSHFMRNIQFQSTLLQEERHTIADIHMVRGISIHAPTRGATYIF